MPRIAALTKNNSNVFEIDYLTALVMLHIREPMPFLRHQQTCGDKAQATDVTELVHTLDTHLLDLCRTSHTDHFSVGYKNRGDLAHRNR